MEATRIFLQLGGQLVVLSLFNLLFERVWPEEIEICQESTHIHYWPSDVLLIDPLSSNYQVEKKRENEIKDPEQKQEKEKDDLRSSSSLESL